MKVTKWSGNRLVREEIPFPLTRPARMPSERGQAMREYALGMIASTLLLAVVVFLVVEVSR